MFCKVSDTWSSTLNKKPASAEVNVQPGDPKLQVVADNPAGLATAPNTVLPTVVTCTFLVTVLLPGAIVKPFPPVQFTVGGGPDALKVPLTPAI
jgi:hypothetical protein